MLYALVQSGISDFPNQTVTMQFFETVSRYGDFFKVRKDCILPTLQAMVGPRCGACRVHLVGSNDEF